MAVTVSDERFGALVARVANIEEWMKTLDGKVDNLIAAYNQAKGVAYCLTPFRDKIVGALWTLLGLGLVFGLYKLYPVVAAVAVRGGN